MLDGVDQSIFSSATSTFLDPAMGGGQFLFQIISRLKANGHSNDNIKSRVFGYEGNPLYVSYVAQRYLMEFGEEIPATLRLGGLDIIGKISMKFNLVLGNPPYQNSGEHRRKKTWISFVIKSHLLLKPNGAMAFITPNAWKNNSGDFQKIKTLIGSDLTATKDCNDSFPGIGENIGYWIYSKDPSVPKIKIEFEDSIIERIFNKVKKTGDKWYYMDVPFNYEFSRERTDELSYPVYESASQRVFVRPDIIKYKGWKVIVNKSGYYPKSIDDKKYCTVTNSYGVGTNAFGIKVDSEQEGYNVLSWVTSKLYRCVVAGKKTSGFNQPFIKLTHLGVDKMWTDLELYSHFNLTQEEIDYIEDRVV